MNLSSTRKGDKIIKKLDYSTKIDQYWSFWCQGSSGSVVPAVEVTEAAEVLRPEKS
jgi:hypothetical protein